MKNWTIVAALLAFATCGLSAQDEKKPAPDTKKPAEHAAGMQNPKTPEHAFLATLAGDWDFTLKVPMGEGGEPMTIVGTSSEKLVMDGLYLVTTVWNEQFEGRGITGYDRYAKEFVTAWVDIESHIPSISRGTYDAKTKTYTGRGDMNTAQGPMPTRAVTVFKDDDTREEKVYSTGPDGSEKLFMEFSYKRRKAAATPVPLAIDKTKVAEDIGKLAGKWKCEMSSKGAGSDDKMTGTEEGKLFCAGNWIWTELVAAKGAEKWTAIQILGFDPTTKKYHSVWIDSSGGSVDRGEGTSDGKVRTTEGVTYDRAGKKVKWWETSAWTDADHRTLTWKMEGAPGQPGMEAELKYERVK